MALTGGVALADPAIEVTLPQGVLKVQLDGWYAGSAYRVWRAANPTGAFEPLANELALCTGDCFVVDPQAIPGRTYYYRFDLVPPEGGLVTYGPYAVAVPAVPLAARVWPNPGRGPTLVELSIPGGRQEAAIETDARIVDLQGRTVRQLVRGPLGRGASTLTWDGRGPGGRTLGAGVYFLVLSTPLGRSTARILRIP